MRLAAILLVTAVLPLHVVAQMPPDPETVWREFLDWYRTYPAPTLDPQEAYRAQLQKEGIPEAEALRRSVLVGKLAAERTEALEIWFNYVFTRETPSFRTEPNALLVETAKDLKPGRALDVAMGQGRNAIWLASRGWTVTGFDISGAALAAAQAAAKKNGLKIETVQSGWQTFDFGTEQWDLVVLSYAFVPVWDPAFLARLRASLRKDGVLVFEHFLRAVSGSLVPRFIGAPEVNELPRLFLSGFRILRYEDTLAVSDWFPRKAPLARMVARKM
jgi:2-polyprenyl-3-methyl-5-hydroxy-6-metoxy-1,4-benzoquinol methylase